MTHHHRKLHHRRSLVDHVAAWFDSAEGVIERRDEDGSDAEPATIIRTVYKTMAPSFKGAVGVQPLTKTSKPQWVAVSVSTSTPEPKKTPSESTPLELSEEQLPTAIVEPKSSISLPSVLAQATGEASVERPDAIGFGAASAADKVPSSSLTSDRPSAGKDADDGPSTGAKIGITFGILGAFLLVGLLVFFLFNRGRKAARMVLDDADEKFQSEASLERDESRSNPKAPRISLRPVTQFLPNWTGLEKRSSKGNTLALAAAAAIGTRPNAGDAWDRPNTSNSAHSANPFGNQAERPRTPKADMHSLYGQNSHAAVNGDHAAPSNTHHAGSQDPLTANGPAIGVAVAGSALGVGPGAAAAATRRTSMRHGGASNGDVGDPGRPPTAGSLNPAGTELGASSNGAASAAAASGAPRSCGVHRVQLDFNPSLDDEMSLKAGDLVRLIHEYDDGWALAIRLDRSQQGVVPRTCLSTRPVKQRAPPGGRVGPPVNTNGGRPGSAHRSMTPQARPGLPESPSRPRKGSGPPPVSFVAHDSRSYTSTGPRASPVDGPTSSTAIPPQRPPSAPLTDLLGERLVPGQAI
ncbi:hypothetical protein RJ55_08097 [Drechmeria coniospora]|nr:hypothetical protein RJ55_08097 [Drechmeria coniospora]